MWGELACHKRLFNPPPQFSKAGHLVSCLCVCVCVRVRVFGGLSVFFVFGWRVCVVVWRGNKWGGVALGSFSSFFMNS